VALNPGARLVRIQCLSFLPDSCDRIEADLDAAQGEGAQFAGDWNQLAWTHVAHLVFACPHLFDAELALEYARRADAGLSDVLLVRDTLGLALYRNGEYEEAREVLQGLVDVQPRAHPATLFSLAMSSWKLGHRAEAREHFQRGSARLEEILPNDPESLRLQDEAAQVLGIERK
jgi:tetratricopeptide (TPR) repeat protein